MKNRRSDVTPRGVTRRSFVRAALGSTAAYGFGRGIALGAEAADFDVVIVGAGTAGIAAARVCRAAGAKFVVLEARKRVGGRTHSNNSFTFPVDLGAEWFMFTTPKKGHPGKTNNPLFDLARKQGLPMFPDEFPRVYYRNHRPLPLDNPDASDAAALYLTMLDQVDEAGRATEKGRSPDISWRRRRPFPPTCRSSGTRSTRASSLPSTASPSTS